MSSLNSIQRFHFEREALAQGMKRIAGVDEAGRGPLAGPVVAAAVVLPFEWLDVGVPTELAGLNDSKQVSERQRERFFSFLTAHPQVMTAVEVIDCRIIDEINILKASHLAMARALSKLTLMPDIALVDGLEASGLPTQQIAIVKGDSLSYSIAAASILAKVTRDRLMVEADVEYPAYGFAKHKGYPTSAHRQALRTHGPCPLHRRTFLGKVLKQADLFD